MPSFPMGSKSALNPAFLNHIEFLPRMNILLTPFANFEAKHAKHARNGSDEQKHVFYKHVLNLNFAAVSGLEKPNF